MTAVALTAVYLLSIVSLTLFKDRSFRGGVHDAVEVGEEGTTVGDGRSIPADYDATCDAIACAYGLTGREREVLGQLGQGNTVVAIAKRLVVSESTVKYHTKVVYKKLGIHTRQELLDMIQGCAGEPG